MSEPPDQDFDVFDASTFDRDVARTADLLGTVSASGWEIAEITSDRIFTTNRPALMARERKEGRVSAAEWSAAVTTKGKEHFGQNAAKAHARCWRRYGEVSERHPGWSFLDHLQAAYGSTSTAVARVEGRPRRMYVEPLGEDGQRVVMDGLTQDQLEDVAAAAGLVPEVPAEHFNGDYAQGPTQATATHATPTASRIQGMKTITLVFTNEQYDVWVATIKERQQAWGCDSGSTAALELLRRSAQPSSDELEARFQFWLAIHSRDLDPVSETLTRAAFSAGAQVPSIARPLTAEARANRDVAASN